MSEERCREAQGKRRKLGCYASHAATRLKKGAIKVTRWHGGEEQKHPLGYFMLGLLAVGLVFCAGGAFLAYNFTISNPTALESSLAQTTTWKDASGNALADGATVSGVITVQTTIPAVQVAESASITIKDPLGYTQSMTAAVPYYVVAVEQYVYKSGDSTPLLKFIMTPSHSSYATDMYNWLGAWGSSIVASYDPYKGLIPSKFVVPAKTYTAETWSGTLDTLNLAKGGYQIFTCITWSPVGGPNNIPVIPTMSGVSQLTLTSPEPPSLSSASWHNKGAIWLSSLVVGEDSGSVGPQVAIAANPTTGDPPLEVAFNSSVIPGTDGSTDFVYLWDFDDGNTSIMAQLVHNFTNAGIYHVKLTVTDTMGNSGSETITITVGSSADGATLLAILIALGVVALTIVVVIKRR